MSDKLVHRPGQKYTEQEIDRGLFALAMANGNTRRASEILAYQEITVPHTTLDLWKRQTHAERYEQVREEVYPRIAKRMAEQLEDLFQAEVALEAELVEKMQAEVEGLSPRDVSGALRNVAVTRSLASDKAAILRGQPTAVVAHVTAEEALRKLERFPGLVVDSDAEEIEE
jgi:hypothetical protein